MKRIFILSLVFVLLLALIGSGTVGSFNDTETSADNQLVFQWEQECPRGKFNVANDDIVQGSFDDKVFMYDEYGSLLENNIIDKQAWNELKQNKNIPQWGAKMWLIAVLEGWYKQWMSS